MVKVVVDVNEDFCISTLRIRMIADAISVLQHQLQVEGLNVDFVTVHVSEPYTERWTWSVDFVLLVLREDCVGVAHE